MAKKKKKNRNQRSRVEKKTVKLSLCMIARDEADFLAQCLESVQGLVDEILGKGLEGRRDGWTLEEPLLAITSAAPIVRRRSLPAWLGSNSLRTSPRFRVPRS